MAADGGMAAWCTPRQDADSTAAEIHLNYWRIEGDTAFVRRADGARDFVEVGVFLDRPRLVESVCIFLPGEVWDVDDCGPNFVHPETARGIFNEELACRMLPAPNHQRVELSRPDGEVFCCVYRFRRVNGGVIPNELLTEQSIGGGLLLTVTRQAIEEASPGLPDGAAYFRLRAYVRKGRSKPFIREIHPWDKSFQSGYSVVEYVDFRFNEVRTLPPEIARHVSRDLAHPRVRLRLVVFLAAVPVLTDVTSTSTNISTKTHKVRLLEHDLWNAYVPFGIPEGMMVYHWKAEEDDNETGVAEFSAFVKMQTRRTGSLIIAVYLAIAFAFGVFGNLTASAIWDKWFSSPSCPCPASATQRPSAPPSH